MLNSLAYISRSRMDQYPILYKDSFKNFFESTIDEIEKNSTRWIHYANLITNGKTSECRSLALTIFNIQQEYRNHNYQQLVREINDPIDYYLAGKPDRCFEILANQWGKNPGISDPELQLGKVLNPRLEIYRCVSVLAWSLTYNIWNVRSQQALRRIIDLTSNDDSLWMYDMIVKATAVMKRRHDLDRRIDFKFRVHANILIPLEKSKKNYWYVVPRNDGNSILWYEPAGYLIASTKQIPEINSNVPWQIDLKNSLIYS